MDAITPINLDAAYLNLSSATETWPAWLSGSGYSAGFTVSYDSSTVHGIYQRLIAGAGTVAPNLDLANWEYLSPSNRWAMFDNSRSTRTWAMGSLAVVLQNLSGTYGVGLFGLVGTSVTVSVQNSGGTVTFQAVKALNGTSSNPDQVVLNAVVVPAGGTINILLSHSGGAAYKVECGACVLGRTAFLGVTQPSPSLGIVSYSRKVTDEFGMTTFVKRASSKRLTVKLRINNTELDSVYRKLEELDGVPFVLVCSDIAALKPLDILGFLKDFSIDVAYVSESLCSIEFEGLA